MAGCTLQLVSVGVGVSSTAASMATTTSRSSPISGVSAPPGVLHRRASANDATWVAFSSRASLFGAQLSIRNRGGSGRFRLHSAVVVRAYQSQSDVVGQDPGWTDDDYIVVGLAHCFRKDEDQKLQDAFVIEPIPAGGLECMENGGMTCYVHASASSLGVALKQDVSLLAKEFAGAGFCEGFDFRAKCASRTWKRDHPRENLMNLVPRDGTVRSDWNFSLQDKRVLNQEHVVKDSDNIKQDMSIDVYGRTEKEEEMTTEIGQLYNV